MTKLPVRRPRVAEALAEAQAYREGGLKVLSQYDYEDLQIIEENDKLISTQQYLKKEHEKSEKGNSGFIDIYQLENDFESTIRKFEA